MDLSHKNIIQKLSLMDIYDGVYRVYACCSCTPHETKSSPPRFLHALEMMPGYAEVRID